MSRILRGDTDLGQTAEPCEAAGTGFLTLVMMQTPQLEAAQDELSSF